MTKCITSRECCVSFNIGERVSHVRGVCVFHVPSTCCCAMARLDFRCVPSPPQYVQLVEGNSSVELKAAVAAAKSSSAKSGGKAKGKSSSGAGGGGGGAGGGDKKKGGGRLVMPTESLSELALACFEECVSIAAHCSSRTTVGALRTGKVLSVRRYGVLYIVMRALLCTAVHDTCIWIVL